MKAYPDLQELVDPIATGYFTEESARTRRIMYALIKERATARKSARNGDPKSSEGSGSGLVLPPNGEIFPSKGGRDFCNNGN